MSIKQFGKQVERGIHRASWTFALVSMVMLLAMMLLQTADVIGRYVFSKPITSSYDMIEVMMALLVFWGLAYCASDNGHVRVDLILSRLGRRTRETLDRFTFGAGAFILALITWRLADRAWTIIQNLPGPATQTTHIPYWPFLIVAAIGTFLFCLEHLVHVFNPSSAKREADEFLKEEAPVAQEIKN
jgi:TRAP-type C4-dicarboxylate transport system permease small subunit